LNSLTVRQIRSALPRLDQLIAQEGEILITRRGQPIARLLPARPRRAMPSHAALRARMSRLAIGSEVLLSQDRDLR